MLYSLLSQIHTVTKNIVTVEDPIEFQVPGVNQVQVDEKSKKTFGAVLRAMLRQDPDVMMIGEIRDLETAQIAFRASITGHLVLSTVHTNDAPSAITRLVDLGLQPYMVASSLIGVVSMRLVRTLCPRCKDGYGPSAEELRFLGISARDAQEIVLYRPVGCDHCLETGFRGRTGVFELLDMNDAIRRLIASGSPETVIRQTAIESGMVPIGQDGMSKVLAGETCIDEVQRVLVYEEEVARLCTHCHATVSRISSSVLTADTRPRTPARAASAASTLDGRSVRPVASADLATPLQRTRASWARPIRSEPAGALDPSGAGS